MNENKHMTPQLPRRRQEDPKVFPVLSSEKISAWIQKRCGDVCVAERHGSGHNKVFILPEAFQEFKNMVSYGRRSPMNRLEQKYAGFGHFFVDEDGSVNVVVSHFISILTTNRSTVSASNLGPNGEMNPGLNFLEYHRNEFHEYEQHFNVDAFGHLVDPFLRYGHSEFVLEGHTHPDLGAFWSHTDKVSGSARAATSPVCIFVCDPIRREMLGCVGAGFENAEVIVYDRTSEKTINDVVGGPYQQYPPVDELVRIANSFLRKRGYSGHINCRTRFDGKINMKIKMVIPKNRKGG